MSVKRRLAAAGLPVAGVTVFAALALTGQPASAAVDAVAARQGITAGLAATCDPDQRTKCGYGSADDADYGDTAGDNGDDTSTDDSGDTGSDGGDDAGAGAGAGDDDDRGNDGYGGESPSPTPKPSTTPSGGTDEVPPGGEGPETAPPGGAGPDEVPNGNGGTLPLTGAPMAALTTVGGLLTAAGAALCFGVWYNARRRRSA
jgi:hypothetical protein